MTYRDSLRCWTPAVAILALGLSAAGCAGVKYARMTPAEITAMTPEERQNFGVPFYEGKQYLLVTNGADANGQPMRTIELVNLPDRSKPYRAYVKPGFGRAKLDLTLENGVVTSTSATGEAGETFADLLGAVGTAAVVPSKIAVNEAQALLNIMNAREVEAETMTTLAASLKEEGDTELAEMIKKFVEKRTDPPCHEKPATGRWYVAMGEAKDLVSGTAYGGKNKIVSKLATWMEKVCESPRLNFKPADNFPEQSDQIRDFRTELKRYLDEAVAIRNSLPELAKDNGCSVHQGGDCQVLRKAAELIKKKLEATMGGYLPRPEDRIPPFELYEIEYTNEGDFAGLKRVYPTVDL